jgi:hypothetical protein
MTVRKIPPKSQRRREQQASPMTSAQILTIYNPEALQMYSATRF